MAKNTGHGSRYAAELEYFKEYKKFGGAFERNPAINDRWIERNGRIVRRSLISRVIRWFRGK